MSTANFGASLSAPETFHLEGELTSAHTEHGARPSSRASRSALILIRPPHPLAAHRRINKHVRQVINLVTPSIAGVEEVARPRRFGRVDAGGPDRDQARVIRLRLDADMLRRR